MKILNSIKNAIHSKKLSKHSDVTDDICKITEELSKQLDRIEKQVSDLGDDLDVMILDTTEFMDKHGIEHDDLNNIDM